MASISDQHLSNLVAAADQIVATLQHPAPVFELDLCWSENYESLFRKDGQHTKESVLLEKVLSSGRVILAGRGGGGKSMLVQRLMVAARERHVVPILIRLQSWARQDYESWKEWTSNSILDGATFLIERFGQPSTSLMRLDWLPPTTEKLLLVDGLNEVSTQIATDILKCLDEVTRNQIGLSVLVTDRLVRRDLPPPARWALASVLPLSPDLICSYENQHQIQGGSLALLDLPFFLDGALKRHQIFSGSAKSHHQYFISHSGLSEADLDVAAKAAFTLYQDDRARTFPCQKLCSLAGERIVERLVTAGAILRGIDDSAYFSHHLLHDYLAARHVASLRKSDWSPATLDAISFNASSFDTIALVFEQLDSEYADIFLRQLYDWNLYAAGYALAESSNGMTATSSEMQSVIFAMLGEKVVDPVLATRQRARDALLLIQSNRAKSLADSQNIDDVLTRVRALTSTAQWFKEWQECFCRPGAYEVSDKDIDTLFSSDSVIGWTMANVAKRTVLPKQQQQRIRKGLANSEATIRWRIVHVLGSYPSDANVAALMGVLDQDKDESVKYGAVRSLVEMIWRSPDDSKILIVEELKNRIDTINRTPRLRKELSNALIVDPKLAPLGWEQTVAIFSREFYIRTEDALLQDQWRTYVTDADRKYRAVRPVVRSAGAGGELTRILQTPR